VSSANDPESDLRDPRDEPNAGNRGSLLFEYVRTGRSVEGVDFSGSRLNDRSFKRSDLGGVVLRGVRLERMNFVECELSEADLSKAELVECTFQKSTLDRAVLAGAILKRCTIKEVRGTGADLSACSLEGCEVDDLDLSGGRCRDLSVAETNLKRVSFREAHLHDAHFPMGKKFEGLDFRGADLTGAYFENCDLTDCKFVADERAVTRLLRADLRGVNLTNLELDRVNLDEAVLTGARAREASFRGASLRRVQVARLAASRADFSSAKADGITLTEGELEHSKFVNSSLCGASLQKVNLTGADLRGMSAEAGDLTGARLDEVQAAKASFVHCPLIGASFGAATLDGAILRDSDLCQVGFGSNGSLANADLRGAKVDGRTRFDSGMRGKGHSPKTLVASVSSCRVERHQLELLVDFGGLTTGQRMTMKIEDGVAKLRSEFSGWYGWLHLLSLCVFVAPYLWFLTKAAVSVRLLETNTDNSITLGWALLTYITSGGQAVGAGFGASVFFVPTALFLLQLIHNLARFVLLGKTKRLELIEASSGLPVIFSLKGGWLVLYKIVEVGFWFNLILATLHAAYWLQVRIDPSYL